MMAWSRGLLEQHTGCLAGHAYILGPLDFISVVGPGDNRKGEGHR